MKKSFIAVIWFLGYMFLLELNRAINLYFKIDHSMIYEEKIALVYFSILIIGFIVIFSEKGSD